MACLVRSLTPLTRLASPTYPRVSLRAPVHPAHIPPQATYVMNTRSDVVHKVVPRLVLYPVPYSVRCPVP